MGELKTFRQLRDLEKFNMYFLPRIGIWWATYNKVITQVNSIIIQRFVDTVQSIRAYIESNCFHPTHFYYFRFTMHSKHYL